jgi:hypothetical protein
MNLSHRIPAGSDGRACLFLCCCHVRETMEIYRYNAVCV